ncbi:hypothetical protein GRX01_10970 [Halobaculum sp. WSA2]|uniref:DUF5658 domain-containing protein n=1 Tax=Halobaculum saliterrae TaxID=2073113 RepID=A0A6B0ST49_9EURY|nr:hypothetical protein [Halobaculum saliterrae]MXR41855.1 hypothetical protein [Halobaculum saliterrae]
MRATLSLADTPFEDREFSWLWVIATGLYGVGDIVTTLALIGYIPAIDEGNLEMAVAVESFGLVGLIALKAVVFGACLAVSLWGARAGDRLVFYTPPALLAVVGAFTTAYNPRLLVGVA